MDNINIKEIQKIINEKGDYKAAYEFLGINGDISNISSCILVERKDLYTIFKSYHHHDIYEIIYVVDGNIEFYVEEKKYELRNGDMVLIAPNLLHKLVFTNCTECRRFILNFTKEYCKKISTENTDILNVFNLINEKGMHKISFFPEKRKRIEQTFEIMKTNCFLDKFGADLRYRIGFSEVMLLINRVYMNLPEEDLIQKNVNDPYVIRIIEYINNHISQKIQLEDIAQHLSLSISRISHLFKNITGISIFNYIIKKRLVLSKELLKSGETIKNVYYKCGFPDEASFFRHFKQEFNITPKKYIHSINHE